MAVVPIPSNYFHWRLVDTCLEICLSERLRTPDVEHMTRGLPASALKMADAATKLDKEEERPAKRLKRTVIQPLWEAATRARIWIGKDLLSHDDTSYFHVALFLEQAMKAVGEHAPNLTHGSLCASPHHTSLVQLETADNPRYYYFPTNALAVFLQHAPKLKTLDLVGIQCLHSSPAELKRFQDILRSHPLEELTCTTDVDVKSSTNSSTQQLQQKQSAWTSSILGLQHLKCLHLEGSSYLLKDNLQLTNLGTSAISYIRLDILFEPLLLEALVHLISACSNLSHISIGLATTNDSNNNNPQLMKQLAKAVGKSQMDILRIRLDQQLLKDAAMTQCWTDMMKENFTITQFQIKAFTNFQGRIPEQETASSVPKPFQSQVEAFVQMNRMARKRVFSPYFQLEGGITKEGWARSLSEICSAEQLPDEHQVTCMYLYMRQRPVEISSQLLKPYTVPEMVTASGDCHSETTRLGQRKLKALIRSERRFYDLTYELVSLRERLSNFQRSIVDTNDKRMKALVVVAKIKQVSSGADGRALSPTLARVHDKATQLVVCLEHHTGTIGESLGMFRTGDGLKTLTSELKQLRGLIQTSFSMLEEIGATS